MSSSKLEQCSLHSWVLTVFKDRVSSKSFLSLNSPWLPTDKTQLACMWVPGGFTSHRAPWHFLPKHSMFFWLLGPCMQPFLPGNVLVLQRPAQVLLPPTNSPLTKAVTPTACAFIKKLPRTLSLSTRGHTSPLHGALTKPPHSSLPKHLLKSSELPFLKQENNTNHLMRPRKLQLIRDSTSLVAQWEKIS